jgi:ABC-2 type transport system ATP-binding protein
VEKQTIGQERRHGPALRDAQVRFNPQQDRRSSVTGRELSGSDPVVETSELTKRYGSRIVAVDGVSLAIRRGEVYGFLGPNGAGKTTTLRMLLGLIRPTSGTARVLGRPPGDPEGLARVGALIESPAFYPYLSGRRNLLVMARYAGVPPSRVDVALDQVELTGRADDKFKGYSMGMKQRLGVAAALLKDPELLILDEPTNGLDPAGMADMRALIRSLGRGDRTVLLSSHLLGEVEQICDRVGVIQGGKLVTEGTVAELRGETRLLVRASPVDPAVRLAEEMFGRERVQVSDGALVLAISPAHAGEVARALVTGDIEVSELRPLDRSLEEIFLELTGEAPQA